MRRTTAANRIASATSSSHPTLIAVEASATCRQTQPQVAACATVKDTHDRDIGADRYV